MSARRFWCLGLLMLLVGNGAWAQRDPTQPPFASQPSGESRPTTAATESPSWAVIVIDGRPHLVVGTKLYAEGQQLGQARIERITETEIWMRQGGALRKNAIYRGVIRRAAPDVAPCESAGPVARDAKPAHASEPCERK